jgi:hypothetical protein
MQQSRLVRLLILVIVLVASLAVAQEPVNPDPTPGTPCTNDLCAYGQGCYSIGACLNGQRCTGPIGQTTWKDDKNCPKAAAEAGTGTN